MKGQWFLISAVMASGAFLLISVFLKSYYAVDASKIAVYDEAYYFQNIKEQVKISMAGANCGSNVNYFEAVQYYKERMLESGSHLYIKCISGTSDTEMMLASDRMVVYENAEDTITSDPWCGDGYCNFFETCEDCPEDCGSCDCNNNDVCDFPSETHETCPSECFCGDNVCEPADGGESECSQDCPPPAICGDESCGPGEDIDLCYVDCACPDPPCIAPVGPEPPHFELT